MLSKVLLLSLSIKPRLTHIKTLIQHSISLKVFMGIGILVPGECSSTYAS